MKINKNNYEKFFIDYIDNNLDVNDIADLMIFLANNPDLENELFDIKNIKLSKNDNVVFNKKALLYKEHGLEIDSFENNCIAYIEGDLSNTEKNTFLNDINLSPNKQKIFNIYNGIKLSADKNIKFNNKNSLRKNAKISYNKKLIISYLSSAAAVILFIIVFNLYKQKPVENNYEKLNFSYLDNNIINNVKQMIEDLNDNFIPDLY